MSVGNATKGVATYGCFHPCFYLYSYFKVCPKRVCISTVGRRTDLFARDPYTVPITDFFGSVRKVDLSSSVVNVTKSINAPNEKDKNNEEIKKTNDEKFVYPDLFDMDTILKQAPSKKL